MSRSSMHHIQNFIFRFKIKIISYIGWRKDGILEVCWSASKVWRRGRWTWPSWITDNKVDQSSRESKWIPKNERCARYTGYLNTYWSIIFFTHWSIEFLLKALSKSVATSMGFLRKNGPPAIKEHFKGSKPTQDYFMLVNNFFDGANRRHTAEAIIIQNWPSIKQVWNVRFLKFISD